MKEVPSAHGEQEVDAKSTRNRCKKNTQSDRLGLYFLMRNLKYVGWVLFSLTQFFRCANRRVLPMWELDCAWKVSDDRHCATT